MMVKSGSFIYLGCGKFHFIGQGDDVNPDPDTLYVGTCVPEKFAVLASQRFPNEVEILNEEEWADFYDNRAHVNDKEEFVDLEALQTLKLKKEFGIVSAADDVKLQRALDPEDSTPGIRRNKGRYWEDTKNIKRVKIKNIKI